MKNVIKRDGELQPFEEKKIVRTAFRAGLTQRDAERVARKVANSFASQIQAKELYRRVLHTIKTINKTACCKYQVKEAIAKIDPELFEIFIQKILTTNGYTATWNRIVWGDVIEHQIDVLAQKDGINYFVECKRHRRPDRDTGLGKVLQVFARLEDIQDGFEAHKNDYDPCVAWMITNTRFSAHARKYAKAKGIRLTGWNTGDWNLHKLVEAKKCYPTTILNLGEKTLQRCNQANLLTLCDILADRDKARQIFGQKYQEILNTISRMMK